MIMPMETVGAFFLHWYTAIQLLVCQVLVWKGSGQSAPVYTGVIPIYRTLFPFDELRGVPASPFLHPVEVPLDGCTTNLVYEIFLFALYNLQISWGCTLSHHPVHCWSQDKIHHCSSFIQRPSPFTLESYLFDQAWFLLHRSMLTTPSHLLVLPVFRNGF